MTSWKPVSILRLYRRTAVVATATATTISHHGIMKGYSYYSTTVIRCALLSLRNQLWQRHEILRANATVPLLHSCISSSADSSLDLPHLSRRISSTSSADGLNLEDKTIMEQITMAKAKLRAVATNIPSQLYQHILHDLSSGHVPPSFHAVVMGQPCVAFRGGQNYNKDTTKHQLLAENAVAGHGEDLTQERIASRKDSPLSLESDAVLLDRSINDDGSPCLRLQDVGTVIFVYNVQATNVAVHLVNQKAIMCGYGVESTHLIGTLGIEREKQGVTSWYLLTHPQSRGAITTCFNTDSNSLMIGSPGIGKSWSLLYALQQALLYDNSNVLLFACKQEETLS
jgi:hypothetical protein